MEAEITSVFTVTEYGTGDQYVEYIEGDGQEAIKDLRTKYPRFTKFVLEGFEINGSFTYLKIWK